jgi:hypothetical protein
MTNTTTQTETKIFKVQVDQLCTIWTTSTKTIEAITQEEADKIAIDMYNNGQLFDELDNYEYVYDSLKETDTMEIINEQGNTLIRIN